MHEPGFAKDAGDVRITPGSAVLERQLAGLVNESTQLLHFRPRSCEVVLKILDWVAKHYG